MNTETKENSSLRKQRYIHTFGNKSLYFNRSLLRKANVKNGKSFVNEMQKQHVLARISSFHLAHAQKSSSIVHLLKQAE